MHGMVALGLVCGVAAWLPSATAAQQAPYGTFAFHDTVTVPGTPAAAFDRFVDVNAWWDHRFSANPVRFYIEPRPGGGFWEIFDHQGNGVKHAEVIYVRRPDVLRMEGPLGLSGFALQLVTALQFTARGDSTVVALEAHAAGEVQEGWPNLVRSVWHHFLAERYKPYSEGRFVAGGWSGRDSNP